MSWGNVFHAEEAEDSFWPSFTDIMMVIVMTFLLVTVAVVLANTRLLDELKSSVVAEEEAKQKIEFTLKENATLEEQLDYFQQRSSSLEMELLRSRAQTENTRSELFTTQSELSRLQSADQQKSDVLAHLEQDLATRDSVVKRLKQDLVARDSTVKGLEAELKASEQALSEERIQLKEQLVAIQTQLESSQAETVESRAALANLREQTSDESLKLASLQGEYDELDKKYQKLLKPTRSSKGKTVVDVMYSKSGYRIRKPGESAYRNVGKGAMDRELSELKSKHGTNLYVKIIIPENSGLSYNKAWVFTRDTLNKYDYYYQGNEGREDISDE